MILVAIIACEIAFWVAIVAGLVARYPLRRPRLGVGFLVAAPLIDLVLLTLVTVDLLGGATASWHHGLAALYIGISIAYGHRMIAWLDAKFATRFRGAPRRAPLTGAAYTVACWKDVARTVLAVDHTKFGRTATYACGRISDYDLLVTDAAAPADELRRARSARVQVRELVVD